MTRNRRKVAAPSPRPAPSKRPSGKIVAARAKAARMRRMWLILVDGEPVAYTTAYTRTKCLDAFVAQYKRPWAAAVDAGYSLGRADITYRAIK